MQTAAINHVGCRAGCAVTGGRHTGPQSMSASTRRAVFVKLTAPLIASRVHSSTRSQREEQQKHRTLLSSSVAAFSYRSDENRGLEELCDADHGRCDYANADPVNVAHTMSFALRRVLGRIRSTLFLFLEGTALPELPEPLAQGQSLTLHDDNDTQVLERQNDVTWTVLAASMFGTALTDLSGNLIFMSAFWSWFTAQTMKYVTTFYREGKWDWRVMFDSGGMPSSHTSLVVGLTTAIAYQYGLASPLFPLSLAFSLIVMYDAAGVRRHAGKQAAVLNRILENMFAGEAISEDKLKEVLGHSPLQVLAGAVLGVFIGVMYMHNFGSGYAALA